MSNNLSLADALAAAVDTGRPATFIDGGTTYTFSPSGIRSWLGATLNSLPATTFTGLITTAGLTSTALVTVPGGATALLAATTALSNGSGAGAGTISNAPTAGNPTKWIAINDAGTTRYIPAW